MKDLTFANDGNVTLYPNKTVNFAKNWTIYDIVRRVQQFQRTPYPIKADTVTRLYCMNLKALPEKEFYALSLRAEPRDTS
jgi:hypothetical protein